MRGVERYRRADDTLSLSRAFFAPAAAVELRRPTNLEEWARQMLSYRGGGDSSRQGQTHREVGDAKPRVRSAVT